MDVPRRRHRDPTSRDRGQRGLAAPRPIFIVDIDGGESDEATSQRGRERRVRIVALRRKSKEDAPSVLVGEIVDGERLESIELGVEQLLEFDGVRARDKAQLERRITSQRCL